MPPTVLALTCLNIDWLITNFRLHNVQRNWQTTTLVHRFEWNKIIILRKTLPIRPTKLFALHFFDASRSVLSSITHRILNIVTKPMVHEVNFFPLTPYYLRLNNCFKLLHFAATWTLRSFVVAPTIATNFFSTVCGWIYVPSPHAKLP